MAVFITNGDSLGQSLLNAAWHDYDVVNCRECHIVGPLSLDIDEHFHLRETYLSKADDDVNYREKVVHELYKIKDHAQSEPLYLWFENDLFCQTNYWFCIYLFSEWGYNNIHLIFPKGSQEMVEINFGNHTEEDFHMCYQLATQLHADDITHGRKLWIAYATKNLSALQKLKDYKSPVFNNHSAIELQIERMQHPLAVHKKIDALMTNADDTFDKVWIRFQTLYPMYGFGDTQILEIYQEVLEGDYSFK